MAIQRVGNSNVYIIETNVPEPTDSRGRGYGFLVSDQRWKVWDEISKMTAADMRAAGAADDDIVRAQAQQQRLLQSQISDLVRQKNSLIAGAVTKDAAVKAKTASGSNVEVTTYKETTKEIIDSFGDKITLKVPERVVIKSKGGRAPAPEAPATETPIAGVRAAIQPSVEEIDKLIGEREAELDKLKSTPVGTSAPQQDLMTQVQQRYAAQMGYGGFGLSKSAKPTVDYSTAAGDINALLQNAEDDAAMKYRSDLQSKGIAEGLPEVEAQVRADARAKTIEDIYTSVVPKPKAELPVEGPKYNRAGLSGERPIGPRGGVVEIPASGEPTDEEIDQLQLSRSGPITVTSSDVTPQIAPVTPRRSVLDILKAPQAVPAPAGVRDVSMSQPEIARRAAANEAERQAIMSLPQVQVTQPKFDERAAIFEMLGAPLPNVSAPTPVAPGTVTPRLEDIEAERRKQSFEDLQKRLKETTTPLTPGLPGTAPSGAKMSVPQRRDAYALAVVEGGARLAAQPKKFERLAKTNLPQNERAAVVPQFITIVDKLYDVNAGKATAFKSTYDEISRFYANAPDTRKAAHEYLTAKDILATNTTKPV